MYVSLIIFLSDFKLLLKFTSLILLISLLPRYSYADEYDTFNIVASSSFTHDSNVFRLPSGFQPSGTGAQRADNILVNSAGFTVNKQYSLQTFRGNFDHVETKYDNASFLNFKANNYKMAWLWAITPNLTGVLSADRTVSLVPFQDLRSGVAGLSSNISQQNIRTNEMQIFSVDFSPHGNWHLIGGYNKLTVENSQTFLPETSFKLDSVEGGVKYVFASNSYISFVSRDSSGKNQDINNASLVGQGFDEKQQELTGFWLVSGKSRIVSNIGRIKRTDDTFSVRDFSGAFGGINYIWDITGKTSLSFGASRRLSAFQTDNDSYSVRDIIFVNPSWNVTSKIIVKANAQIGRQNYEGDGPIASPVQREDSTTSYGLGLDWIPRSTIRLGLALQHDEKNSNINRFDYSANVASVNGQLSF